MLFPTLTCLTRLAAQITCCDCASLFEFEVEYRFVPAIVDVQPAMYTEKPSSGLSVAIIGAG
jgi:hypothetical protein